MKAFDLALNLIFAAGLAACVPILDRAYDLPQAFFLAILGLGILTSYLRDLTKRGVVLLLIGSAIGLVSPVLPFQLLLLILALVLTFLFSKQNSRQIESLKTTVIVVATVQSAIALLSYLSLDLLIFAQQNGAPVGTVGNADLMASVIAAGLFYLWDRTLDRRWKIPLIALLAIGLLSTRSRGTLALTVFILGAPHLSARVQSILKWGPPIAASLFGFIFWSQIAGRVQLWIISLKVISENALRGVGLEKFSSAYFNANLDLMQKSSFFRAQFGPWSSQVSDAHNIFLQWTVEAGLVGSLVAIGLLIAVGGRALRTSSEDSRRVLILLAVKSLYTVVLASAQGIALGALSFNDQINRKRNSRWLMLSAIALVAVLKTLTLNIQASTDIRDSLRQLKFGAPDLALETLNRARQLEPKNTDVILAQAFAHMKAGECLQSRPLALEAAAIQQNMDVFKRAGHILFACTFYAEALDLFKPLSIVFPEHRTTSMKLAWIYYHTGEWDRASDLARSVLQSNPRRQSYSDEKNLLDARRILKLIQR